MNKKIREYSLITIGTIITALALEYFFFPNDIAAGGVSGIALVLNSLIGLDISITVFVLNVILFILAFWLIGSSFGAKSIYSTILLSAVMWVIENFFNPVAITDNFMLATIFGSATLAMGTAIIFHQEASTGGTTIIAKILNKYLHIPIGQGLLASDFTVTLMAIYAFGVEKGLFGLLSTILIGNLIDRFIDGLNPCKQVFIVTGQEKLIVDFITKDVNRGCTVLNSKGGYTGERNSIIYTVLNRNQFITLKQFIVENNPEAFITVNEASEVVGLGFKNY